MQDTLVKLGLLGYGGGAVVIFKGVPSEYVLKDLSADSFRII